MRRRRARTENALASARPAVASYALLLTWNQADADARADDALIRAFARRGPRDAGELEEHARREVVARFVRDSGVGRRPLLLRAVRPRGRGPSATPAPEAEAVPGPGWGFADLDAADRAILVLDAIDGLAAPEIAERLGLEPGEVRSRLTAAMHSLGAEVVADTDLVRIVPYAPARGTR